MIKFLSLKKINSRSISFVEDHRCTPIVITVHIERSLLYPWIVSSNDPFIPMGTTHWYEKILSVSSAVLI